MEAVFRLITGLWTGNRGNYIAEVKSNSSLNTLEQLALLVTGDASNGKLLGSTNKVRHGQTVNVAPLLVELEKRLRENAVKAIDNVGINFGEVSASVDVSISNDPAKLVDEYFDGVTEADERRDCDGAAFLIYAKAVRDTISAEVYNALDYSLVPYIEFTGKPISDMQKGNRAYFRNYSDYIGKFPNGGYIAENVVKYAEDLYYGHPKGKLSESEWYEELKKQYNAPKGVPVGKQRTERVPGFDGVIRTFNVAKIAKDVFLYRRMKEAYLKPGRSKR